MILKNNVCIDPNYTYNEYEEKKGEINLNVLTRGNYTTLSINDENKFIYDLQPKFTFGIGLEFEYIFPVNNKKWAIIFEPAYYSKFKSESTLNLTNFSGASSQYDLYDVTQVEITNLDLALGVRYYLKTSVNTKVFLNFSHITNLPVRNSLILKNLFPGYLLNDINYVNFFLGFGTKIHNKYILELRYNIYGDKINISNRVKTENNNVLSLIVGYNLF